MKYPISIRILHFLLMLIVFAQLAVGYGFEIITAHLDPMACITLHKSLGLLGLIIIILLALRRVFYKRVPYPSSMSIYQKALAKIVHTLLYLTVATMGLSGFITSMLFVSEWNWFYIIPIPQIIEPNPKIGMDIFPIHIYSGIILSILVGLHILGVIYHSFKRDGIVRGMF